MEIQLIPVLEVHYYSDEIPSPGKGPFWEYAAEWDKFNTACYFEAGFKDPFVPYLPGSAFVKLSDITKANLVKLVRDEIIDIVEGKSNREGKCPLTGGYVLNVDGEDVSFPQCCCDLASISYWEGISEGKTSYDEGHPTPVLTFTTDEIAFDFEVDEFGERFAPPPLFEKITINKSQLKAAVEKAKDELYKFAAIVEEFNISEGWKIPEIGKLLIWGDE